MESSWSVCQECQGRGKKSQRLAKKVRLRYQLELDLILKNHSKGVTPVKPKGHLAVCLKCAGSGLIATDKNPEVNPDRFPHIAIIGGGIGGIALAIACLHRGIPFTIYERDDRFDARSQGYGLTLQQASKAIQGLGIFSLEKGVISNRHLVHTPEGKVVGEWGVRKWLTPDAKLDAKRTNIHIARQALRFELMEQLGGNTVINWGHQLIDYQENEDNTFSLNFDVKGESKQTKADLIVGADGIRSSVRKILFGDKDSSLQYLDCIVILGICSLSSLRDLESPLLDSETVFQTANGNERIYIMPFDSETVMWQLSFPMSEEDALTLSAKGTQALKEEACRRTQWHDPIPQIVAATLESQISGYPVYDREILNPEMLQKAGNVTLIGDAAHPMSPFKGQGANQALLDALALSRAIYKECKSTMTWKESDLRANVLTAFEIEMIERSAVKVKDSADAAAFLHSEIVLREGDEPRGSCFKRTTQK